MFSCSRPLTGGFTHKTIRKSLQGLSSIVEPLSKRAVNAYSSPQPCNPTNPGYALISLDGVKTVMMDGLQLHKIHSHPSPPQLRKPPTHKFVRKFVTKKFGCNTAQLEDTYYIKVPCHIQNV